MLNAITIRWQTTELLIIYQNPWSSLFVGWKTNILWFPFNSQIIYIKFFKTDILTQSSKQCHLRPNPENRPNKYYS